MCMHAQERNSAYGLRVSSPLCPCGSWGSQTLTCWNISLSLHTYSWLCFPPSLFFFLFRLRHGLIQPNFDPLASTSLQSVVVVLFYVLWCRVLFFLLLPLSFSLPLPLPTTSLSLYLLPLLPSSSLACLSLEVETQKSLSRIGHHDGRILRKLTRHWIG